MATIIPDLIAMSLTRPDDNPMTEEQAERELHLNSLRLGTVRRVNQPRRHLGVISMAPTPGTSRPEWSEVDLVINEDDTDATMAPPPPPVTPRIPRGAMAMPNLKDLTVKQANKALPADAQIEEGNIRRAYNDKTAEGLIVSSDPPAGGILWVNHPPQVTVSLGKKPGNWFRKHL